MIEDIEESKTYVKQLEELISSGATRPQIVDWLAEHNESVTDLNTTTQQHHWVDRGLKLSCEGAGHPNHQSWKMRK